jgi:hypothetical protein
VSGLTRLRLPPPADALLGDPEGEEAEQLEPLEAAVPPDRHQQLLLQRHVHRLRRHGGHSRRGLGATSGLLHHPPPTLDSPPALDSTVVAAKATFSPSETSWSTKLSTSPALPPSFMALLAALLAGAE